MIPAAWAARAAAQGRAPVPAGEVHERIEEILSRPQFGPPETSWVQRLFEWLDEQLDFGPVGGLFEAGLWLAAGLFFAFLMWAVVRLVLASRAAQETGLEDELDAETLVRERVDELRGRARAAREAGELVLALRLYFFALVVGLGKRGDLEYRDTWTNRELLERGHPTPRVRALLAPLIAELDRRSFGHTPTTPADVDRLEGLCRTWLDRSEHGERRVA